jgi:hypothetical protein
MTVSERFMTVSALLFAYFKVTNGQKRSKNGQKRSWNDDANGQERLGTFEPGRSNALERKMEIFKSFLFQ